MLSVQRMLRRGRKRTRSTNTLKRYKEKIQYQTRSGQSASLLVSCAPYSSAHCVHRTPRKCWVRSISVRDLMLPGCVDIARYSSWGSPSHAHGYLVKSALMQDNKRACVEGVRCQCRDTHVSLKRQQSLRTTESCSADVLVLPIDPVNSPGRRGKRTSQMVTDDSTTIICKLVCPKPQSRNTWHLSRNSMALIEDDSL